MNRFLELKSKFKILAGLAALGLCVGFVGIKAASNASTQPVPRIFFDRSTIAEDRDGMDWYKDGIFLDGDRLFGTVFPIGTRNGSTGIDLGTSRTLTLTSDLLLSNGVKINASGDNNGTIVGADAGGGLFSLVLTGSASIGNGATITVQDLTIAGNGNVLDFDGGFLSIASGTTLTLRDIVLRNTTALSITFADNTSTLVLDNVVIELTGNLSINGILNTYGTNIITGIGHSFVHGAGGGAITVNTGSILSFDNETTFDVNLDSFTNNGTLHFNGCTVDIAAIGLDLSAAAGTVLFENRVKITGASTFDNSNAGSTTKVLSGATVELQGDATLNVG